MSFRSLLLPLIGVLALASGRPVLAQPAAAPVAAPPLAGWSDGTLFLRSPESLFVAFPNGRLQTDLYFFDRPTEKMPVATFLVKRARLELFGWIGPWFGFSIGGDFAAGPTPGADPVAPSAQSATDTFVLFAPWRDLAMLQVGQFDAPFTLENRTSDKSFDFIERSATVRAFGIPSNKELGAMVHGLLPSKLLYYSVGVFNGDGQNFRNVDNGFDVMGRAWVAPFALTRLRSVDSVTVGGSFWVGARGQKGLPLGVQQSQGGLKFFGDKWTSAADGKTPLELHQHGALRAYAVELDLPVMHRYGLRVEYLHKSVELDEDDISQASNGKLVPLGHGTLEGWSLYAQVWAWVIGDDTIVGRPGLQLPPRFASFSVARPRHGLQLLARVERLDESFGGSALALGAPALGDPNLGHLTLTSLQLGATYWYTKRFRAMFNYVLDSFGGDTDAVGKTLAGALGGGLTEHEFLFRLAIAL
jgi:hypothetical protein